MRTSTTPRDFDGRFFTDLAVRSAYSEGAGPYRIIPAAVAIPSRLQDLTSLMRYATDSGLALTPRGAGSGLPGGNVGAGIIVDLSAFDRPTRASLSRTANVGAATTCDTLARAAALFGLRLPPDPSSGAFCTLGGMVATNAAGARSLRAGSIRSWVRGIEMVTADGEAAWFGRATATREHRRVLPAARHLCERTAVEDRLAALRPSLDSARDAIEARFPRTRKNASGFALDHFIASGDLVDLIIGSEGTLGVVTRMELQLDLLPKAVGTLLLALPDGTPLGELVETLLAHQPAAVELLDRSFLDFAGTVTVPPDTAAVLIVELEGSGPGELREAVAAVARAAHPACLEVRTGVTGSDRAALWAIRHGASPALAALPPERRSVQVVEDGCVPLRALSPYLAGVRAAARDADVQIVAFGHAGDGHLHVNALVDTTAPGFERRLEQLLDAVTRCIVDLGGTPSGEHGDGRMRAGLLHRIYGPEIVELFGAVKRAFDPHGILNPGVIIPNATPAPLRDLKIGPDAAPIPDRIAGALQRIERTAAWGTSPMTLVEEEP
ncbi:MAG TPA: FAD-binding oxidoreductase [Gemmatimonadales bacterium]